MGDRDDAPKYQLTTPIESVEGISPGHKRVLRSMGLTNIGRLIAHLPFRYEHELAEAPIETLEPGRVVTATGEITATRMAGFGKRARFEAVLMDPTGRLDLVWFNQGYLRNSIHPGMMIRVQGTTKTHGPNLRIANPRHWLLDDDAPADGDPSEQDDRIRPVYPASEGIDSRDIERAIGLVLEDALPQIEDHLPDAARTARDMPTLAEAYRIIHRPSTEADAGNARRRLAYDELLLLQLGVHLKRAEIRAAWTSPEITVDDQLDARIRGRFPFTLTPSQDEVIAEIIKDLEKDVPANRLLQGDVGSGKTAVAVYAMLAAVAAGHQAALMAPTEVLAEQHFSTITQMLEGSHVEVDLLTAKTSSPELHAKIERGESRLLIGTHALLSAPVEFASLGLAVIDEQHRFGVAQRARLRGSSGETTPHVLVMTATPIPRTLAMTIFGDLDVSTIDAPPGGRPPVETKIVMPDARDEAYARVEAELAKGGQAFVVAPSIEDASDQSPGVERIAAEIRDRLLPNRRVGIVHGRLHRDDRAAAMRAFRNHELDVLVATTVIEVGVDVPNASAMVIERADQFGLAQLHQLRGRIGRGTRNGLCILLAARDAPEAIERLGIIEGSRDGFVIAERDFEIRGPGELIGSRQSGAPEFKIADLVRDRGLLELARRDAARWIEVSQGLARPEDRTARRRVLRAHGAWLGLVDVG